MHSFGNKLSRLLGLNRTTKIGAYTVAVSAVVLAVLIVVNLLIGLLPKTVTKFDTTENNRYTLSATSEKFVRSIDEDVTVYVLCEGGEPSSAIRMFFERYGAQSAHLKIKYVDPIADPTFLDKYPGASSLSQYSMIVESARRLTAIEYSNLEYYYVEGLGNIDASTYRTIVSNSNYIAYYAQYGIDLTDAKLYFAGEQAMTGAVEYVTMESIPHLYVLTGNGEAELSSTVRSLLSDSMTEYESLNLLNVHTVPDDASAVLVNAPASDLTETEATALRTYLAAGGNLILLTAPGCETFTNLMSVMSDFGLSASAGMLYEGNANLYTGNPYVLIPEPDTKHAVTGTLYSNKKLMLMPESHGITVAATLPEELTCTTLLKTSSAYVKSEDGTETDVGSIPVGVAVVNNQTGSKVVWYASASAFTDEVIETCGNGAAYGLVLTVGYEAKNYTSALSAIEAIDMTESRLTTSAADVRTWLVLFVIAVPAVCIISGIVIWVRRRRK